MNPEKTVADRFLHDNAMHPDHVKMESTVDHMMAEMTNGLNGKPSSLAMIPTYMEVDTDIPSDEKVVVLDAGGTTLVVWVHGIGTESMGNEKTAMGHKGRLDCLIGFGQPDRTLSDNIDQTSPLVEWMA